MTKAFLAAAAIAAAFGFTAAGASAANIAPYAPGTPLYGPVEAAPPAGEVPPAAPSGYQYHWVYSYDHHGYRGHWEAERIGM